MVKKIGPKKDAFWTDCSSVVRDGSVGLIQAHYALRSGEVSFVSWR